MDDFLKTKMLKLQKDKIEKCTSEAELNDIIYEQNEVMLNDNVYKYFKLEANTMVEVRKLELTQAQ